MDDTQLEHVVKLPPCHYNSVSCLLSRASDDR